MAQTPPSSCGHNEYISGGPKNYTQHMSAETQHLINPCKYGSFGFIFLQTEKFRWLTVRTRHLGVGRMDYCAELKRVLLAIL